MCSSDPMDASTLVSSGDMFVESRVPVWATTNNTNDTLVFQPSTAWTGNTDTLIIDVDSTEGVPLPALTLNYSVDTSIPTAFMSPESDSHINALTPIVIGFTIAMEPATLVLAGTLAGQSDGGIWSSNINTSDTLTISPSGAWAGGAYTLFIDVEADNGVSLTTLPLTYVVDDANPSVTSVTPATGSTITCNQTNVIVYNDSVDIATLTASGLLWDNSDKCVWSKTTNTNDTLTLSPATSWPVPTIPVPTIDLMLDVADLVGNSLAPLNLVYTVDTNAPEIFLNGDNPVSIELGTPYVDAGATALDIPAGYITANMATINPVVDAEGTYTVTYNVMDAAGNAAVQVTRTVTVTADITPPVITVTAGTDSVEQGGTWTDAGATTTDNVDADGVAITTDTVDTNVVGDQIITYTATDAANNDAIPATRTVTVKADIKPPSITVTAGADSF